MLTLGYFNNHLANRLSNLLNLDQHAKIPGFDSSNKSKFRESKSSKMF